MKRVKIIAEVGINHNGNIKLAKKLIMLAKKAGADLVKFQIYKAEELCTKKAKTANYQFKSKFKNQFQMLKKYELSEDNFIDLSNFCKKVKIEFCASFFNHENLSIIKKLNIKSLKIPSGEITNFFLLKKLPKFKKKIIFSTGMSTTLDIQTALNLLTKYGASKKNITILHCNSEYPTPLKDINLNIIPFLKKRFKTDVGYSDHSTSKEVPLCAVALGATIIEKHFTLDKNLVGPDHKSSFDFKEFKQMVDSIRKVEVILGNSKKIVTRSEKKNLNKSRQFLIAKKEINRGEFFSMDNVSVKRTGSGGMSPMVFNKIMFKKSQRNYKKDEKL